MREASSSTGEVYLARKKRVRTRFPLPYKSLPPSVEGKTHGTLKLVIDKVLWTRSSPGNIMVIASWWGEHDSAHFRPIDIMTRVVRENNDTMMIYPIKTNAVLFEEYIKKCETIELLVVLEKTQEVIGIGYIGELSQLFTYKSYSQIIPILNNSNNRIGKMHVCLYLTYLTKFSITQIKKQTDDNILSVDNLQCKNIGNIEKKDSMKRANIDRSIKTKRSEMQKVKHTGALTDKLVEIAEIVTCAQQLRKRVFKETCNEDFLDLNDSSMSQLHPYITAENETKLNEYMLGKEMTFSKKENALNILRIISPSPSLIASKTIDNEIVDNKGTKEDKNFSAKLNNSVKKAMYRKMVYTESKEINPLKYVNSMRIYIASFMLTSAGYRHIKHYLSYLAHSNSIIYFVQFDTKFGPAGQRNIESDKETKFIRIYAKKEQKIGTVIEFGSEGICSIPRYILNKDFLLRFKIFAQCVNQNPSELGRGHLNIVRIAHTKNLSLTLGISISGTGIKKGILNIRAELGCHSRFGQEFVQYTIMSTKENIPVLEIKSYRNTSSNKYRNITGTHSSKSSNKVSSISAKRIERLTSKNDKGLFTTKDLTEYQEQNLDNKKIDISNPESATEDKVLLYGLIYVSEGKCLSESNTYLICRAFWRDDKAMSQVQCSHSGNPCYNFSQLVPLIYGTDLLERIRENYIIIEVYSRQNQRTDNLLGIAKLPVHELYIAYKDPLVLPVYLLSKDPIIGVDDWVSINDPVSGIRCGELLTLVALGTAEQIAYLEMTRNLRIYNYHYHIPENMKYAVNDEKNLYSNILEVSSFRLEQSTHNNQIDSHIYNASKGDWTSVDYKTQESQTDISSLKNAKHKLTQKVSSEHFGLHALVDRLANALHYINKNKIEQSTQTEINGVDEGNKEELRLNTLNIFKSDNDNYNTRNSFQLPIEMYRSVGVGAEYDEELNQQQNNAYNNCLNSIITERNTEREETNINCNSSFFRSTVKIECGLHLPEIEGRNRPSTYVTFQDLTHQVNSVSYSNSYRVTNVFTHSCNPKWNWICEAKLPTDLLLNNQKRLILKVWYLIDPDTSTEINLEKDIMIGFVAINLSVLMSGFTTVSGWFDIMDFTEQRNGQIKISITPLDVPLKKIISTSAINSSNLCNLLQINKQYLHDAACNNVESNNTHQNFIVCTNHKDRYVQNEQKSNNSVIDFGHGLEDISMSFLSLSLKQKLTELDHITKRLQSRLHDVTNVAFEDEFDNDFDITEPNSDNENTGDKNGEIIASQCTVFANEKSEMSNQCETKNRNVINDKKPTSFVVNSNYDPNIELLCDHDKVINSEAANTGYYSHPNTHVSQHPGYYHNLRSLTRNFLSNNSAEYPVRGTKTHINHLLDKLSLDLSPKPLSGTTVPIRKNILELFANLRSHKNNSQDQSARDVNICSMPTQTDNTNEQQTHPFATNLSISDISDTTISESIPKSSERSQSYSTTLSTIIREELVAEENNDNSNCDELTTYLITSNIRHMDYCIFNPLLYQHLLPDLQAVSAASPEEEATEQLDNRYTRNLDIRSHLTKNDVLFRAQTENWNVLEYEKNTELFHLIPSVSGNIDNSIDVTIIHKSDNNDLMSDNSAKLTTVSCDKTSVQQVDIEKNHYSIESELLIELSGVLRQAPEGGNSVEEAKTSVMMKRQNCTQDTLNS